MSISKRRRFAVLERDDFACRYCGRRAPNVELEVDHVVPKSRSGLDIPSNLVTACHDCNRGKRDHQLLDIHDGCLENRSSEIASRLETEARLDEAEERIHQLELTIDRLRDDAGRHVPAYAADILREMS